MKIDDKVITFQGEKGVIIKPWNRDDGQYSWWVELHFTADGKEYTTLIPYKESELEIDKRNKALDELTKQAQDLDMGY
tara:strand:- start:165 stop:398 length:234 start_codon:yes stop_codon:yes gene_type:complete